VLFSKKPSKIESNCVNHINHKTQNAVKSQKNDFSVISFTLSFFGKLLTGVENALASHFKITENSKFYRIGTIFFYFE
jgi:hypothetical protein